MAGNDHSGDRVQVTSPDTAISGDGTVVGFYSQATNLVPGGPISGVYTRSPDAADTASDLFRDDQLDDTVLRVLDLTDGAVMTLCPAADVAVASGRATFLRPEVPDPGSGPCPAGSLNGPAAADVDDLVVHLWSDSEGLRNLGRAATKVAISGTWLAALVSECDQAGGETDGCATGGTDVNADGDAADEIVEVHSVSGTGWLTVGEAEVGRAQAADDVAVSGLLVAFTTPEAAQGENLNPGAMPPDGDTTDRVLQVYDAGIPALTNVGYAAEEFVIGSAGLVAFRTLEASQGGAPLNGDPDAADAVLQVWDSTEGVVVSSGQAVTPCRLEACDPRVPYRVLGDTVRFLTFECTRAGRRSTAIRRAAPTSMVTAMRRISCCRSSTSARPAGRELRWAPATPSPL